MKSLGVLLLLLATPLALASPPSVEHEDAEVERACDGWSYESDHSWDRFDGPRWHDQRYHEGGCASSSSASLSVTWHGHEVASAEHDRKAFNASRSYDSEGGGTDWNGTGEDHGYHSESSSHATERGSTNASALGASASHDHACERSAESRAQRGWANRSGWSFAWDGGSSSSSAHCAETRSVEAGGYDASIVRAEDCEQASWYDRPAHEGNTPHRIYERHTDSNSTSECVSSWSASSGGAELARAEEHDRCAESRDHRFADWDDPDHGFSNDIDDRTWSCSRGSSLTAGGVRVHDGREDAGKRACYAHYEDAREDVGPMDSCHEERAWADGTWVTLPNGALVFVGNEGDEKRSYNSSGGRWNEEGSSFEGARVRWDDAPAGPLAVEQPADLP